MSAIEALTVLREEICALIPPHLDYLVSVRWQTEFKGQISPRPGRYICRLIENKDWETPKEEWRFPRTEQMREWFWGRVRYLRRMIARQ
jgi:hypothetical protein